MKSSRVSWNVATSLLQQIVSVICAFVLPRMILSVYGSAYNGIVNSVTQFLSCVTLLRAGIGGVTRAVLYKSLEEKNIDKTSAVVKATEMFMRKVALVFSALLVIFAAVYPLLVQQEFDWFFSFSLVLILGISTVVQYYFGITNQILLHADQRLYVYNIWQIISTILNALISVGLISAGFDIRVAKLGGAVAFSITPIVLFFYVRKNYRLKKNVAPDNAAIEQRWDAAAHQLAAFVHSNTDVIVLTICTDLRQVSVYSVYAVIVGGINQMISSVSSAVEAMMGRIMAQGDSVTLRETTVLYEWLIHVISVILFSSTNILIVPFVMLYTSGIRDANYAQQLLGGLMCLAYWISAIRMPYQNIIEAAGHFKQTKRMAIIEAALNIVLSCILVVICGAVGVIIGTVVAMSYRTISYAAYALKRIIKMPFIYFLKRLLVSALTICVITVPFFGLDIQEIVLLSDLSYGKWFLFAIITVLVAATVTIGINLAAYPKETQSVIALVKKKLMHK